jgi:hypothetical protein
MEIGRNIEANKLIWADGRSMGIDREIYLE